MRIKLDENLPAGLVPILAQLGHDAETVPEEGLGGRSDQEVWDRTQAEERFLITQDLDFSDARRFLPGTHCGILILRLRDPGRLALMERVKAILENNNVEDWRGALVVASERKVRVVRGA